MALVPAQNKGQLMERNNNGPLVATEQALTIFSQWKQQICELFLSQ